VASLLGLVPQVAKPEKRRELDHSEQLRRRADQIYADLASVRKIEIIVRRR